MTAEDPIQSLISQDEEVLKEAWGAVHEELMAVEAELRDLTAKRDRLQKRRSILTQIIELRELEMPPEHRRAAAEANGRITPREVVATILNENPDRVWDAQSLQRVLAADHDFETSMSNARVLLQRLVADKRARRVGRGEYQAAHGQSANLLTGDGGDGT